jgi:hypothetical protein
MSRGGILDGAVRVGRCALAVSLLGAAPLAAEPPARQPLVVKAGARQTLPVKDLVRVAIQHPDVADVEVARDRVEVLGRVPGQTELRVWRKDGEPITYSVSVEP